MSNKNTGAYPTIDSNALYPGLVQGVTPLQEREGGSKSLQSGNRPAFTLVGLIVVLIVIRLLWEAAE